MVVLTAMAVAIAIWNGTSVAPISFAVLGLRFPGPALAALVVWAVVRRLRASSSFSADSEAEILDRIVVELEGGASPRSALARVASGGCAVLEPTAHVVAAGLDHGRVAGSLREAFSHNGRLVAAAWALAAESGAPAAPVMTLLARRASERGRLERERRGLTAQARATAWVIAGLPLAVCLFLVLTGRLRPGPALPVVLVGIGLQAVGLGIIVFMLRRAR